MTGLPPSRRGRTLVRQALITGRLRDSRTGGPPAAPATVRLLDLDAPGEDYPLPLRLRADGGFAFHGEPETAFPEIAHRAYRLRVEARVPGYAPGQSPPLTLGPAAGQPASVDRPVPTPGISPLRVALFTGGGLPRTGLDIALDPDQVRLRGRVVKAEAPDQGIAGATVELQLPGSPTATTGADGRFEFPNPLPRLDAVALDVEAAGFEDRHVEHELDYARPVNTLRIELKKEQP